jgi:hypothetical protein
VEEHFVFWPDTGSVCSWHFVSIEIIDEFVDLCYRSDTASALCLFQMDFQASNDLIREERSTSSGSVKVLLAGCMVFPTVSQIHF